MPFTSGSGRQTTLPLTGLLVASCWKLLALTGLISLAVYTAVGSMTNGLQKTHPFADYLTIFPGQPLRAVQALGFACVDTTEYNDPTSRQYCSCGMKGAAFPYIGIFLKGRIVTAVEFVVLPNTLNVGDLAAWWGRPRIRLYGQVAYLDWPEAGIRASAEPHDGRFSYFMPLLRASFSQSSEAVR
jgi:hypothetical protein